MLIKVYLTWSVGNMNATRFATLSRELLMPAYPMKGMGIELSQHFYDTIVIDSVLWDWRPNRCVCSAVPRRFTDEELDDAVKAAIADGWQYVSASLS